MELDEKLKQKLTKRLLKKIGEPLIFDIRDIYMDLLGGMHTIKITTRGKFTIAEVIYCRNNYTHHFLGVSAKNPNDVADAQYGIKVATEEALFKLFAKFLF